MPSNVTELLQRGREILEQDAWDARSVGFAARALVQATLPHKKISGNEFTRRNGHYSLTMLAPSHIGLPYGTIPRLLLVWLATEVVRTRSRTIVLGTSMAKFLRDVGVGRSTGGEKGTITMFRDQIARLFTTTISITQLEAGRFHDRGFRIADETIMFWDVEPAHTNVTPLRKAQRIPSQVTLSKHLYEEIIAHPVPIDLRAIRPLQKSPLAIDLYCWLTYRASYTRKPVIIPWDALMEQFGVGYSRPVDFRINLVKALAKVKAVYPAARADVEPEGLRISPARTHIRRSSHPPSKSG